MFLPASNACDQPNSTSPLPPNASADLLARTAVFQNAFPSGNAALNNLMVALGGNPTSISGVDPVAGNAGIPTTGEPVPPFPGIDRLPAFLANGGNRRGAGRWSRDGGGSGGSGQTCTPPVAVSPVIIPLPPVQFVPPPAPAPAAPPPPPAAPVVAAPASAPVCVRKSWKGSGLLPDRDYLECTIDGQYSCGWNEYMMSLNYDQPWASDAAKAAAQAKYQKCLQKGNVAAGYSNNASAGLSGVIGDSLTGTASPVVWGLLGAAGFLAWAMFYQKGRK